MLVVVSPAKNLDYETPPTTPLFSEPDYLADSELLIKECVKLSPAQLSSLMHISDKLAGLNAARFSSWSLPFTSDNAKQAILAFNGDVYSGIQAEQFSQEDLEYAQQHMRILSGLYGLLKPLDLMQPYRLEMGTKLNNQRGKNLYEFWGDKITQGINDSLQQQGDDVLVNLASNEYFKSVKVKNLKATVITPVFKDKKNGEYKVISFFAKKARGLMARYIIEKRLSKPEQVKQFDGAGYQFSASLSNDKQWVFTREEQ
ncbi:peroxide stress protein YaaA [Aliiglaciecola sp. SL4]|uniref:peroxide stress protein YaaA n=1 Tax=Aliiglaciecola sp. SL4 TaxID=3239806 RepID=UPI00355BA4A4